MHIPDDPGYYEKFFFTPGDLGFTPIKTSVGTLGVLVCWDQWYPEAARLMTLAGADLLIYPTAIGWDPNDDEAEQARQREAWITIQRSHAVANGIPVLSINRTGFEPSPDGVSGAQFWGSSFVAGCQGELLAQAATDEETEPGRRTRQRPQRIGPPHLALPARPPHRRLRRHHLPFSGLTNRTPDMIRNIHRQRKLRKPLPDQIFLPSNFSAPTFCINPTFVSIREQFIIKLSFL